MTKHFSSKSPKSISSQNKHNITTLFFFLFLFLFLLTKTTFAQDILDEPESVVYDSQNNRYLVSNVGHGKIVEIDSAGNYSVWNEDQASIRGLVIVEDKLYAACDAGVAVFDLTTAQRLALIVIAENGFLNDITTDGAGYVYVNDNGNGNMYKIDVQTLTYWIFTQGLVQSNGILFDEVNNRLLTNSWDESGRATIHGIITTSMKLTGDMIMTLMITDPDLAHAIHQWIVDAYLILIGHFAGLANMQITSVHVGECAGTMISSELYEAFVIPYINQLGDQLGEVRLHSCGLSDHLVSPASQISNLRIFDTGSETSVEKIRQVMGKDFEINVAPPVKLLQEGVPESAILEWLDKTLEENQGGPLLIVYHLEPDYETDNCFALHKELEKRELITPGRVY